MEGCRVTVARHEAELTQWEMARRAPHPSLRQYVHGYVGNREETARPLRQREIPSDRTPLIISFGDAIQVTTTEPRPSPVTYTSFIGGMYDRAAVTEYGGRQHGLQVDLTPFGAFALLAAPMHEFTNTAVHLADVLGSRAEKMITRLAEAVSWDARFVLLDDALVRWIAVGPTPSPTVAWAWHRLRETGGRLPIGGLADDVGWSRRHLVARFREQVGLPPKAVARVLRFKRALGMLVEPGVSSRADVAVACGYYDQAHFNREFRTLAGCTPSEFLVSNFPGAPRRPEVITQDLAKRRGDRTHADRRRRRRVTTRRGRQPALLHRAG